MRNFIIDDSTNQWESSINSSSRVEKEVIVDDELLTNTKFEINGRTYKDNTLMAIKFTVKIEERNNL